MNSPRAPPLFTEPGDNTHKGAEIGIDDFQATGRPVKAIAQRRCVGFGRARRAASTTMAALQLCEMWLSATATSSD
jgi:hypothetical protein